MSEKEFIAQFDAYHARIEEALANVFDLPASYKTLLDAMRYSLLAGGKRLRPMLTLAFCKACGGDSEAAMDVACGVEMLHTYSLIHDDLPCMDNDALRRGKPTNHVVFGEWTALLAGDALQCAAFESVLSAPLAPAAALRCGQILAQSAGFMGMCGGQQLDMQWEERQLTEAQLREIYRGKTSALLRAACTMGVAAALGTEKQEKAASRYADALGLAFQIRDDMLDVIGDEAVFGKPIGSDKKEKKTTYVDLFGIEGCKAEVTRLTEEAVAAIKEDGVFDAPDFLIALAYSLVGRSK